MSFTTNVFDDAGQLVATTDANSHTTQYVYDDAGRRVATIDALQHATLSEYDDSDRQVSMIDSNLRTNSYVYDDAGRMTSTIFPDGTSQSTTYDLLGRKTFETNQTLVVTAYGYDPVGKLVAVTNALGTTVQAVTRYIYDEVGNLVTQLDANQYQTKFEYDAMGRRTKRTLPDLKYESNIYSLQSSSPPGASTLRVQHTDFNFMTTTTDYDAMGRLLLKTPDASLPQAARVPVQFTYYPATGLRSIMSDASGLTTYIYDTMDRLTNKAHQLVGGLAIGTIEYKYDLVGNVLSIVSDHGVGGPAGISLTYHWDELNRLSQV